MGFSKISLDVRHVIFYAYLQDKIYIGNNVELTPAFSAM